MEMSVFEIIGPPMIGPSSSHTAGACRIGWACQKLLGATPKKAIIGLHGSFWATGQGHGTDEALVAGLLGFPPDDARLKNSFRYAKEAKLDFHFEQIDLGSQTHPNSVRLIISTEQNQVMAEASSVGGGSVLIFQIDEYSAEIRGTLETLVIWHQDSRGFLARITSLLADADRNVATIRTSRHQRGEGALTVVEIDGTFPSEILQKIGREICIKKMAYLPILPGF